MITREDGFYWCYDDHAQEWIVLQWVNYLDAEDSAWFPRCIPTDSRPAPEGMKFRPWVEEDFRRVEGPLLEPSLFALENEDAGRTKLITVLLPPDLDSQVKEAANASRRSISAIISDAIELYLAGKNA